MRFLAALFLLLTAIPASGAPVAVDVRGPNGKPLAGAVVQVSGARMPPASSRLTGPFVVAQKDISFQPHVLIVPVGASVSFPNRDKVRHHVYSFSKAKKFELKLYGQQETRLVVFEEPGVVALGCNIHDSMSGFVIVVDTPFAAQTDASGHVAFGDVPPGAVTLSVWHPSISAPGNMLSQSRTLGAQGVMTIVTIQRR